MLPRVTFYLLIIGGFIALPTSVVVFNKWAIALSAHNYSNTRFTIDYVGISNSPSGRTGGTNYKWASGTIDGEYKKETIGLTGFNVKSDTAKELQKEFPKGTILEVSYNPSAYRMVTQGRTLRVIPRSIIENSMTRAVITTLLCCGILLAGVICYLISRTRGYKVFPTK